jgi:hypothetical protein
MGRKFYEADIPKLTNALERIANQMEVANKLEEKKMLLNEKLAKLQMKEINENRGSK